jgi:hypothetical protein
LEAEQFIAWERVAFVTESYVMIAKYFAFFLDKRALFISGAATFTVRQFQTFCPHIIFQSKVITANAAVHSTGRN